MMSPVAALLHIAFKCISKEGCSLPLGTMQPNQQQSIGESIGFILSRGLILPGNNSPYTVAMAVMVAGRRHGRLDCHCRILPLQYFVPRYDSYKLED